MVDPNESNDGSVTHWIRELKEGSEGEAQQEVWNRYYSRLMATARRKLSYSSRRISDEEDIAIEAAKSFFEGVKNGEFPDLRDRQNLWPLLAKITARKACNQITKQMAKKRGRDQVLPEVDLRNNRHDALPLEQLVGTEPKEQFAFDLFDELQHLLAQLSDKDTREIVELKLQGYSAGEIADRIGVSERTVERRIKLVRDTWEAEHQH